MKKNIFFVRTAGVITTLFCVFHLSFYWLLHWKERLSCLDTDTWAIFHGESGNHKGDDEDNRDYNHYSGSNVVKFQILKGIFHLAAVFAGYSFFREI